MAICAVGACIGQATTNDSLFYSAMSFELVHTGILGYYIFGGKAPVQNQNPNYGLS